MTTTMTLEEKAQKFDELVSLLRKMFPGNGEINFDGEVIEKIKPIINPHDEWIYFNKTT